MFNMSTKFAQSRRGGCPALEKSGQYMEGRDVEILPDGKEKVHREGTLNWGTWAVQMTVWCVITVLARLMVTCTMLLFKNPALETVSALIAQDFSCQPDLLLVLVMIGCPICMNIAQLWVQDQFLKAKIDPAEMERISTLGVADDDATCDPRASFTAGGVQVRGVPTPQRPQVKEYKQLQKQCCNWCLSITLAATVIALFFSFGILIGNEQEYYDPCYTQVRNDDPAVLAKLTTNTQIHRKEFFGYNEQHNLKDSKYEHDFNKANPNCAGEKAEYVDGNDEHISLTLKQRTENRLDLRIDMEEISGNESILYLVAPRCMCCNSKKERKKFNKEDKDAYCTVSGSSDTATCPDSYLGECCGRSTIRLPNKALKESCSVCNVYNPCDRQHCAARPDKIRNAQHLPMIFGLVLSFLSNGYVLYTYFFDTKLQQATITQLLMWASLIEMVFCVCMLLQELSFHIPNNPCIFDYAGHNCEKVSSFLAWPTWENVATSFYSTLAPATADSGSRNRGVAINFCQPMSFIFQLTWTASDCFYFMISVDLMLNLYSSPFGSTQKRMRYYQLFTWTLSFSFAFFLMYTGDWGVSHDSLLEDFCWNVNFGRQMQNETFFHKIEGYSNYPYFMTVVYGLSVTFYMSSFFIAIVAICKVNSLSLGQQQARGKTIAEGRDVVLASAGWLLAWALFYKFVVLAQTEHIVQSILVFPKDESAPKPIYPTEYQIPWHKHLVQMWAFLVGGRNVINFIIWRFIVIPRLNKNFKNHFLLDAAKAIGGVDEDEDDTLGEELQKVLQEELLFFTGLGIRGALRKDVVEANTHLDEQGGHRGYAIPLDEANDYEKQHTTEFSETFNGLFVPDTGSSSPRRSPAGRSTAPSVQSVQRLRANNVGVDAETVKQRAERNRHLTQYKFKTYRPKQFGRLRKMFNIDSDDGTPGLLHEAMRAHQQGSFTGGASGSFMYYSSDKRFIVKQISHTEMKVLLDMLDDYERHMTESIDTDQDSPTHNQVQSMLLRVLQCNRMKMYHSSSRCLGQCLSGCLYFIVTENLLHKAVDPDVFDLKGSWVNRSTLQRGDANAGKKKHTMKDNDLREKVYLNDQQRELFVQTVKDDAKFLCDRGIMDYSLLLGIEKGVSKFNVIDEEDADRDALILPASHANSAHMYYVGIIDILQEWDSSKKQERFCKALLGRDLDGVSSIEPEKYLERFVRKMTSHVYEEPAVAAARASSTLGQGLVGPDAQALGLLGGASGRLRSVSAVSVGQQGSLNASMGQHGYADA